MLLTDLTGEHFILDGCSVLIGRDIGDIVENDVTAVHGRQRTFGPVALCENPSTSRVNMLDISEIQSETVTRKVAVCIEGDSSAGGVDVPNAAVVIKIEIQVQAIATGQRQNGNHLVVTLAADYRVGDRGDYLGPAHDHDGRVAVSAGIQRFDARSRSPGVRGRAHVGSTDSVTDWRLCGGTGGKS